MIERFNFAPEALFRHIWGRTTVTKYLRREPAVRQASKNADDPGSLEMARADAEQIRDALVVQPHDLELVLNPGSEFQSISKKCPAFTVEVAALGLRKLRNLAGGQFGVLGTSERKVRLSHRQQLLRRCTSYSWSTIGLRNGRSSPRATVSGIANEYRPNMLMWSWISGESLATSAS
jgi:hypothetical protein